MSDTTDRVFEYEGGFYARPVYRGITMDTIDEDHNLDDIFYKMLYKLCGTDSGVSGRMRIRFEVLEIDTGPWVPRK